MQKIHVRLSVEIKVPDKLFRQIVDEHNNGKFGLTDVEVAEIRDKIDWNTAKPVFDGWDDGGYIPFEWLTYDAVESGIYDADEDGVRRNDD